MPDTMLCDLASLLCHDTPMMSLKDPTDPHVCPLSSPLRSLPAHPEPRPPFCYEPPFSIVLSIPKRLLPPGPALKMRQETQSHGSACLSLKFCSLEGGVALILIFLKIFHKSVILITKGSFFPLGHASKFYPQTQWLTQILTLPSSHSAETASLHRETSLSHIRVQMISPLRFFQRHFRGT